MSHRLPNDVRPAFLVLNLVLAAVLAAAAGCGDDDDDQVSFPDTTALVDEALGRLSAGDLSAAHDSFAEAAFTNPADDRANLLYAITHLAVSVIGNPNINELISRSGGTLEGSLADVCTLRLRLPDEIPAGAPRTGEIIDAWATLHSLEVEESLAQLRQVSPDVNIAFELRHLPECLRPATDVQVVEVDRADVISLEAAIETLNALSDTLGAYDLDVDPSQLGDRSPQMLFSMEPNLLNRRALDTIRRAGFTWERALSRASEAIALMQGETDEQSDDVLVISPEDDGDADEAKLILDRVRESLAGPSVIPADIGNGEDGFRLDLSPLFSGQFSSLRPFLPPFDEDGEFDGHHLPDPTFGGMAPELTQEDLDDIFSPRSTRQCFFINDVVICTGRNSR